MYERIICLDTETTGLEVEQDHRVIEVGCIEIINRRITDHYYHTYLNPQRPIDPGAQAVHGISNSFLADKPHFSHIAADWLEFIADAHLVIHNAPFDVGFLNAEMQRAKIEHPGLAAKHQVTDTLLLARSKHPGQKNNLDALCKRYNVDRTHRQLHGALLDARLLAQVYLAMTSQGQSGLFSGIELTSSDATQTATSHEQIHQTARHYNLKVIPASAEELNEHQDYLNRMKEKYGVCVWEPEETDITHSN